ncbi:MAG: metallopeptidase TldD-related protein [Candidatus Hodarchaeota archaeon]
MHPERGDFSTTTRSGAFLVKNGEIQKPIRPMRIFDNLPRCLTSLGGIANDTKQVTPWFGYHLVAPTIKFDKVEAVSV